MQHHDKLESLVAAASFDVCSYDVGRVAPGGGSPLRHIYRASVPGREPVNLFKVLLTNVCTNDCAYCINQVSRDRPRHSFQPEELARVFMELHRKRMVKGLFLSSGIAASASRTMQSMINTVEILRHNYDYRGYIHLKILPGASFDCVEEACKLASRVSVNMEAPTAHHLARLTSRKDIFGDILERMRWVKQIKDANGWLAPSGQTTQLVLGAAGETDRDVLQTAGALYRELDLRRVYFSPFRPVYGSRLEGVPATPSMRAHRLYQTDWLMRVYGFSQQEVELALGERGSLSLTRDPKMVIAVKQPWLFPVDVNRAGREDLLRVPGIGPVSASRIVEARREHSISSLQQLSKMRVAVRRAAPFVWFQGMSDYEKQTSFLLQVDEETDTGPVSLAEALR